MKNQDREVKYPQFGANLRWLRILRNHTQESLCEQLDEKRSAYQMWESGYSRPDPETERKIANFYNVSIDNLYNKDMSEGQRLVAKSRKMAGGGRGVADPMPADPYPAGEQEDQRDNAEEPDLAAYDKGGRLVFTADTKSGKTDIVAQLLQELREDRRELREDRRLILENQRLVSETATAAQRAAAAAEKSAGSVAELVATVDSLKETVVGEIARREVLQDKLLRQISVPGQSSPEELEAELHIAWTERMRLYRSDTHSGKGTLHTH